jgi:hypothetical protein
MLACLVVETRQIRDTDNKVVIDDIHYDASEEESLFEMERDTEAIQLEKAAPILDMPATQTPTRNQNQMRSVSEPKPARKPWPGKHTPHPRPVLTGYASSDDEDVGEDRATKKTGKAKVVKRYASWPRLPLTPKAHDSGVQGLESSDTDGSDGGFNLKRTRMRKRRREELEDGWAGDEESVMFRGIADADSAEERWRQIVLEEHMDRIFSVLPKLPGELEMGIIKVANEEVPRASVESDDWGISPRSGKSGWKEELVMIVRFFGCMGRGKRQTQ